MTMISSSLSLSLSRPRCPDFDQDGKPDNITFMIKRIKVYTGEALKDKSYRFPGNYGVEKFLEIFSGECQVPPPPLSCVCGRSAASPERTRSHRANFLSQPRPPNWEMM